MASRNLGTTRVRHVGDHIAALSCAVAAACHWRACEEHA
jgi:hypothetical protein